MTPLVVTPNYVLYDEEIPVPGHHPLRVFQDARMTASGLVKQHGVHNNFYGYGGAIPHGQIFDMKAIRMLGWPHDDMPALTGTPRLTFRYPCAESGPFLDLRLEPGKTYDLEKIHRLWGMECFEVVVEGAKEPIRVELIGDLHRYGHSTKVSPGGSQLFEMGETQIQALLPLVERAIPETTDEEKRRTLSWLHRSLRDSVFGVFTGGYHVAQLMKGDVAVVSLDTTEERDAYCKAYRLVADGLSAGVEDVACWKLPEEIESIEDDGVRERAMEAWKTIISRYQD